MTKIKRSMGNLLVSIVELLVGVLLFINPAGVTVGVIIAAGVILILNGIYQIARCFLIEPEEAAQERNLFKGLCAILLGLFCAFDSRWFIDAFPALTVRHCIWRTARSNSMPPGCGKTLPPKTSPCWLPRCVLKQ